MACHNTNPVGRACGEGLSFAQRSSTDRQPRECSRPQGLAGIEKFAGRIKNAPALASRGIFHCSVKSAIAGQQGWFFATWAAWQLIELLRCREAVSFRLLVHDLRRRCCAGSARLVRYVADRHGPDGGCATRTRHDDAWPSRGAPLRGPLRLAGGVPVLEPLLLRGPFWRPCG